ncbi:MAG: transposase family protein [Acidobacteria bacterium]|nr:transposase family protein [Acidobacteriota bacterium]
MTRRKSSVRCHCVADSDSPAEFLLRELVNSTIQDVANKHGVTYDVVRGALKRYVKDEIDWDQIKIYAPWDRTKSRCSIGIVIL